MSLVLCYHALSPSWPADLAVSPDKFERQLASLVKRGYRGATFQQAAAAAPPATRTLAVTFDDAYRSVLTWAHPIMSELGLVGTVFVPTDYADGGGLMAWPGIDQWVGGPHEAELRCLSWDDLGMLADEGWEIGSHTRTHPRLTELDGGSLRDELAGSRAECERRLGRSCLSLAYPYGDVDARVVAHAHEAGYRLTTRRVAGYSRPLPRPWVRMGVYRRDGRARFAIKVTRAGRWLRAAGVPRAARRAAGRVLRP